MVRTTWVAILALIIVKGAWTSSLPPGFNIPSRSIRGVPHALRLRGGSAPAPAPGQVDGAAALQSLLGLLGGLGERDPLATRMWRTWLFALLPVREGQELVLGRKSSPLPSTKEAEGARAMRRRGL